jgi:hypothetical protein
MNTKLLILTGVAITFIASTFAGDGGKKQKDRPDPEKMVARMIENNDANEDSALNAEELQGALVQMHEKRKERMAKMREEYGDREGKGPYAEGKKKRDPAEVAGHLVAEFDFDESGSLDAEELLEALRSMRHRGPHGKKGPRVQDAPPPSDDYADE